MAATVSSRKLDALLKKDKAFRDAAQEEINRVTLSKYRNGHWKPSIKYAIKLERISNNRIRVRGWDEELTSHRET